MPVAHSRLPRRSSVLRRWCCGSSVAGSRFLFAKARSIEFGFVKALAEIDRFDHAEVFGLPQRGTVGVTLAGEKKLRAVRLLTCSRRDYGRSYGSRTHFDALRASVCLASIVFSHRPITQTAERR